MDTRREPRSTWADGRVYAATIDRLLSGVRDYVVDHLPEGNRVLDACCGTGALARRLAHEGRTVLGVDLSPRHIEYGRAASDEAGLEPTQVRFTVGDVAHLDPPDEGPHDVAVIAFALHEMPRELRRPVLENLTRIARRVMVLDFAAPMPWNLAGLRNRAAELVAGPEHFRSFRDYQRHGGLAPLVDGLDVESERTIDGGTLRVLSLAAA